MRRIGIIVCCIVLGCLQHLKAQSRGALHDPPAYYSHSLISINPVFADTGRSIDLNAGYQSYFGIRKSRRLMSLTGSFSSKLWKEENNNSSLGFSIKSQHVGQFIQRSRFHLTYAHHLKIHNDALLSAGIALGAFNSVIEDNPSGVAGSDLVLDGKLGLKLKVKNYFIAVMLDPSFNNSVKPARELTQMQRQFSSMIGAKWGLNPDIMVHGDIYYIHEQDSKDWTRINVFVEFWKSAQIGVGYDFDRLTSALYFDKVSWGGSNKLSVGLSYDFPVSSKTISDSGTYQIVLNLEKE